MHDEKLMSAQSELEPEKSIVQVAFEINCNEAFPIEDILVPRFPVKICHQRLNKMPCIYVVVAVVDRSLDVRTSTTKTYLLGMINADSDRYSLPMTGNQLQKQGPELGEHYLLIEGVLQAQDYPTV